jgi:ribosomal protein S18 acetylase RimI-like enzyme
MFKDMGMTEAALGVDGENPNGALQLYESVGFRVARWAYVYRKEMTEDGRRRTEARVRG